MAGTIPLWHALCYSSDRTQFLHAREATTTVITVDKLSETPLYLQLRDSVIAGIASGELRPGDALPSVRSLAEDLGINLHTVNKAYATLRDEGYVIMLGRRGAYVADAPADPAAGMGVADLEAALGKLAVEFKASGGTRDAFVEAAGRAAARLPEEGADHVR